MRRRVFWANSQRKPVPPELHATRLVASSILIKTFESVANLNEPTVHPRSTCHPKLRVAL